MLRVDKLLKHKGWQDRQNDPFAESEPSLAELWKAALLGRPIDDNVARQKEAQLRGLPRPDGRNCAEMSGFSLHANTFVGPAARDERYKLVKAFGSYLRIAGFFAAIRGVTTSQGDAARYP